MTTIPEVFSSLARSERTAGRIALQGRDEMTFAQLFDRAQGRAVELHTDGVRGEDVVAIVCYNEASLFEYLIACGQQGAALMPLSPALPDRDLVTLIHASGAAVCYCTAELGIERIVRIRDLTGVVVRLIAEPMPPVMPAAGHANVSPDAVCWVATTGGSTGTPRLFSATHETLLDNLFIDAAEWGWRAQPIHLGLAPLAHGMGFTHALGQLITGGTVRLVERYSPRAALNLEELPGSVWTAMVPTMLNDIVENTTPGGTELDHFGLVVTAGAPLPAALRERFLGQRARLIEYYGSTELGWVTWVEHKPGDPRDGLIGWPTIGSSIRIVDERGEEVPRRVPGRIEKRGRAYTAPFERDRMTFPADIARTWATSGDVGYVDNDGAAIIVGREDDMIVVGGLNVYPVEVESVLREHPAVRDVVVAPMRHDRLGMVLHAFVERADGGEGLHEEELVTFAASRLPHHKRPRAIAFVVTLPRTASGKIDRKSFWLGVGDSGGGT